LAGDFIKPGEKGGGREAIRSSEKRSTCLRRKRLHGKNTKVSSHVQKLIARKKGEAHLTPVRASRERGDHIELGLKERGGPSVSGKMIEKETFSRGRSLIVFPSGGEKKTRPEETQRGNFTGKKRLFPWEEVPGLLDRGRSRVAQTLALRGKKDTTFTGGKIFPRKEFSCYPEKRGPEKVTLIPGLTSFRK